jgi:chromosome partitioning protein
MRIIAIANHKGGVGKTTSVMNIGAALAQRGKKVLLVDLDAQANLTTSMLGEEPQISIYNAIVNDEALPIHHIADNIHLVPSSLDMAGAELEISARMSREYLLKDLLEPVADNYDYVLLDCSPSLGIITLNALTACTDLFIPLTAEALPSKGLTKLLDIVDNVKKRINRHIRLSGVIITRYERSKLSQMVEEMLREKFGSVVFTTKIRKNIAIAEAPLYTQDVISYAKDSNGAKDYQDLADEIINT